MKRVLVLIGAVLTVGAMLGVAMGVSQVASERETERAGITEAEHDRLLATCLSEDRLNSSACPTLVNEIVDGVDRCDRGYSEAAEALSVFAEWVASQNVNSLEAKVLEAQFNDIFGTCVGAFRG